MNDLNVERTPSVLAAEINMIKYQAGKIFLESMIEIGRRLKEARNQLQHGEWLRWLEESVNYSERTAQKMIRVFEAYGPKQLQSSEASSSAVQFSAASEQEVPNLSLTQAYILLGVPEEVRGEFIAELDIDSMTTRELQKTVNDWKQAREELDQARQETAELRKAADEKAGQLTQLTEACDNLMSKVDELTESNRLLVQEGDKKQAELKKVKDRASFKSVENMSKRLTDVYNKAVANKVAFLYENLGKTLKELTWEMKELAAKEPQAYTTYKKNVTVFLLKWLQDNATEENEQG